MKERERKVEMMSTLFFWGSCAISVGVLLAMFMTYTSYERDLSEIRHEHEHEDNTPCPKPKDS